MSTRRALVAAAAVLVTLLAACSPVRTAPPAPAGSCTLGLPPGAPDEDAIRAVLRAEGELVVQQDVDRLMALWAAGATIADAKHTPGDAGDDQLWMDHDAIRHRYVRTVFPGAPSSVTPANLAVTVEGDRAVVLATTQIGGNSGSASDGASSGEIAAGGDRWTLVRQGDCWAIDNLTYNLEPAPH